ncbi:MAG TPA: hypothetical protein VLO11_05910 [Luteolibacter sp.]|nr:hypothetical protein [Luteolibacter sp.]
MTGGAPCPYCRTPVAAGAPECPQCKLSFPKACALLGAAPRLAPWVTDTAGLLGADEIRLLKKRLDGIVKRFPQLVPQVVLHHFAAEHPFATHAYWLFNSANLAGHSRRGFENHALLIALDPQRGEAALVTGYGLEVFLDEDAREHLLSLAAEHWKHGRWCDGLLRLLDALDAWLETIAVPTDADAFQKGEY